MNKDFPRVNGETHNITIKLKGQANWGQPDIVGRVVTMVLSAIRKEDGKGYDPPIRELRVTRIGLEVDLEVTANEIGEKLMAAFTAALVDPASSTVREVPICWKVVDVRIGTKCVRPAGHAGGCCIYPAGRIRDPSWRP